MNALAKTIATGVGIPVCGVLLSAVLILICGVVVEVTTLAIGCLT